MPCSRIASVSDTSPPAPTRMAWSKLSELMPEVS
jgi:hypothetical protein